MVQSAKKLFPKIVGESISVVGVAFGTNGFEWTDSRHKKLFAGAIDLCQSLWEEIDLPIIMVTGDKYFSSVNYPEDRSFFLMVINYRYTEYPDALAATLAHEIAHIKQGHVSHWEPPLSEHEQEYAADLIAASVIGPEAAIKGIQLHDIFHPKKDPSIPDLYVSHPTNDARIARIREKNSAGPLR